MNQITFPSDLIEIFINSEWQNIRKKTNTKGRWLQVESPWRNNDTRFCLGFNIDKKYVHDFYLGKSWSFVNFVKEYKEITYKDTLNYLIKLSIKNKINPLFNKEKTKKKENSFILNFEKFPIIDFPYSSEIINLEKPTEKTVMAALYLKNRGVTQRQIDHYNIRYCVYGKYQGRLILPVNDENGNFVWFQARSIFNQKPKYLNLPGSFKSNLIFGLDETVSKEIVLCEGLFDAIKINGCSSFGKDLSITQLLKIKSKGIEHIILALDNDVPGIDGTFKMAALLEKHGIKFSVVVYDKDVNDFGDMNEENAKKLVKRALNWKKQKDLIITVLLLQASRSFKKSKKV